MFMFMYSERCSRHVWLPVEARQAGVEADGYHKRAGLLSLSYFGLSLARVIT